MIVVTRRLSAGAPPVRVEIPEGKDPFEVCAAAIRHLGLKVMADDPDGDAIIEARKKNGARQALVKDPNGRQELERNRADDVRRDAHAERPAVSGHGDSPKAGGIPGVGARPTGEPDVRSAAAQGTAPAGDLPVVVDEAVGVRDTSRAAHAKLKWSGKLTAQQEQVMAWMRAQSGDATRQEIARGTGLGINCVAGRCKELLDAGVLVENARRTCRVTKETANPLRVT